MRTLPPSRSRRLSLRTFLAKAEQLVRNKTARTNEASRRRRVDSMVFNVHVVPIVHLHYCPHQLHTMYCRIADFEVETEFLFGVPMNRTPISKSLVKALVH